MKKVLLFLALILAFATGAWAFPFDKYTIDRKDLPEKARDMLEKYFPKSKVGMIKVDKHLLKKTDYDVRLVDGTTIEFNNKGEWTSIDCKTKKLPEGVVTNTIRRYVTKNFPDVYMVSIKKKLSGYEIGLSDELIVKFDHLGIYKGVKMEE